MINFIVTLANIFLLIFKSKKSLVCEVAVLKKEVEILKRIRKKRTLTNRYDRMRGLGDYCTYQYNTIKNCYDMNENHDDGFQSWSVGDDDVGTGVVYGVVLRGNTIINYEDSSQPFRGTLQGIGCFDGMFEGWLVENNVVITDHWHGITLSGATNCMIINNTLVDCNTEEPGPLWIRFSDHKDGRPSTGCIIRNNLTTKINASGDGISADHNIIIDDYDTYFINYNGLQSIELNYEQIGSFV